MKKTVTDWTSEKARKLMRKACRDHRLKVCFYTKEQGYGGYNYGASAGNYIYLAPFIRKLRGKKFSTGFKPCPNPVECQLAAFFHEFAHCKLTETVPGHLKGYCSNNTSHMQFELWLTMLGLDYAREHYGVKFSDATVRWLLEENMTYANPKWGLNALRITNNGYRLTGYEIET